MKKIFVFSILLALSAPAMAFYRKKPYAPIYATGCLDFTSKYNFQIPHSAFAGKNPYEVLKERMAMRTV